MLPVFTLMLTCMFQVPRLGSSDNGKSRQVNPARGGVIECRQYTLHHGSQRWEKATETDGQTRLL